jgi:hypothetical protein
MKHKRFSLCNDGDGIRSTFVFIIFWKNNIGEKAAGKKLMKVTIGWEPLLCNPLYLSTISENSLPQAPRQSGFPGGMWLMMWTSSLLASACVNWSTNQAKLFMGSTQL